MFLQQGIEYFNPDEAAKQILEANPTTPQETANSAAWHQGKRLLERAIAERLNFVFETTLGGTSITALLERAASCGLEVRVWYVGLSSPELHISRVRSRVEKGGHNIPDATIRERYSRSRLNLIRLLPRLTELLVYDNSQEADPHAGIAPEPMLLLHLAGAEILRICDLLAAPDWAKPILLAALNQAKGEVPSAKPRRPR